MTYKKNKLVRSYQNETINLKRKETTNQQIIDYLRLIQ